MAGSSGAALAPQPRLRLPAPAAAAYSRSVAGYPASHPSSARSSAPASVGIFDSGVGGLSVTAAIHRLRPALPLRYVADTACFPYGERPPEEIAERSLAIGAGLIEAGARLIVVACNTASSAALEALRERFGVPVVGMEPPLKPAVERSRSGRVALLVTAATAEGARLARLQQTHAGDSRVLTIPMPGLADLVERGEVGGPRVEALLGAALERLPAEGVDEVALGCTHYGFVRPALRALLGDGVELIDAAEPVARRVLQQIEEHAIAIPEDGDGMVRCAVSGNADAFAAAVERLRASGVALPPLRISAAVAA